ncbi:hypothetical protein PG994_011776 [Apiospora phragmitis]|uniref:Uncharacterized protein n=1 Tax=Apiospora phragmitis TaxID=2905665 RepID=A0ABR1TVZ8_9PEZI
MVWFCGLFSSHKTKWQRQKPPSGFARYEGGWYVKPIHKDPKAFKNAKAKRNMRKFGWFNDNRAGDGDVVS